MIIRIRNSLYEPQTDNNRPYRRTDAVGGIAGGIIGGAAGSAAGKAIADGAKGLLHKMLH